MAVVNSIPLTLESVAELNYYPNLLARSLAAGFDNIEFSEFANPPLTTVNIPRGVIGRMAVEALLQAEISSAGQEISIEPELVLRDSTGPVC